MQRSEPGSMELNETLKGLAIACAEVLKEQLGESLVTVVLFGLVARGETSSRSDIDLLMIASGLPESRLARQLCLERADDLLEPRLQALRRQGILSAVEEIYALSS
jgi:predicted nucleotidyltransferase